MSKRSKRRASKERMKVKARRLYRHCKMPEKYADNLTICSCWGCCNRRKYEGPTRQENASMELMKAVKA